MFAVLYSKCKNTVGKSINGRVRTRELLKEVQHKLGSAIEDKSPLPAVFHLGTQVRIFQG
jgi:hypothetical protein